LKALNEIEIVLLTLFFKRHSLLNIPEVNRWVNDNRYNQANGRNVKNELLWFVELLKVSLPVVE